MDSATLHLKHATEPEVAAFLSAVYPFQGGPPWIVVKNNEPCIYIDFYRDLKAEHSESDREKILRGLGAEPSLSVIANLSGRHHPGATAMREFAMSVLSRFEGIAEDAFSNYVWTLEEIALDHRVNGYLYFEWR